MRALLIAAALVLTAGCDSEVSRVRAGEPFRRHARESCNYTGVCYTCLGFFNLDGSKQTCGFKLSSFCTGSRPIIERVLPMVATYESGKMRPVERTKRVRIVGACR